MPTTITDIRDLNIVSYDRRRSTGTIPSHVAHGLVQNTRKNRPRKPKREVSEVETRAKNMGVNFRFNGNTIFLTHPKIHGAFTANNGADAWESLNAIALDLVKAMTKKEVRELAAEYREYF